MIHDVPIMLIPMLINVRMYKYLLYLHSTSYNEEMHLRVNVESIPESLWDALWGGITQVMLLLV